MSKSLTTDEQERFDELKARIKERIQRMRETRDMLVEMKASMSWEEYRAACLQEFGLHPDELQPIIDEFE